MATKKKSWQEKLQDNRDLPKVVKLTARQAKKWGKGTMAIPSPLEVNAIMKRVPQEKSITINKIREKVAKKHHADVGCPSLQAFFHGLLHMLLMKRCKKGKKQQHLIGVR